MLWTAEGFSCSMDVLHGVEAYGYLYKFALFCYLNKKDLSLYYYFSSKILQFFVFKTPYPDLWFALKLMRIYNTVEYHSWLPPGG